MQTQVDQKDSESLTIVTCFRQGDSYRRRNLEKFLGWYEKKLPFIKVIVVEQSPVPALDAILHDNHEVIYQQWDGPFNRSWALNCGVRATKTRAVMLTDSDLLCECSLVLDAAEKVFSGFSFVRVAQCVHDLTKATSDMVDSDTVFSESLPTDGVRALNFCGGLVMCDRLAFMNAGWMDEGFLGWGGEDDEFLGRVRKLCDPSVLFEQNERHGVMHLWHPVVTRQTTKHYFENSKRYKARRIWSPEQTAQMVQENVQRCIGTREVPYLSYAAKVPPIHINSQSVDLVNMCVALLDAPEVQVSVHHNQRVKHYFIDLVQNNTGWLINLDEDSFVMSLPRLLNLWQHMILNGIDFCGMPDGGVCWHRKRNPHIVNPFFFILNADIIDSQTREKGLGNLLYTGLPTLPDPEEFQRSLSLRPHSTSVAPLKFTPSASDTEPYYALMQYISEVGSCLYLTADDHDDGWSTILKDHEGKPFLVHSWYAREYRKDVGHTNRIDALYRQARSLITPA